jgi:hypothetical protein
MGTEISVLYPSAVAPVESGATGTPSAAKPAPAKPVDSSSRYPSPVRKFEPEPASTTDYAAALPYPEGANAKNSPEFELAKRAMVKLGVGITSARAFYLMALHVHRYGALQVNDEDAMRELRELYGDELDARLESVRGLAREVAKVWPGFAEYLNRTRLGSYPAFVRLMAQVAEQRAAKR